MSNAKRVSMRRRRGKTIPVLGAAGLLTLASGASAEEPVDRSTPNTEVSREAFLGEEEVTVVSLATFYVFDHEIYGRNAEKDHRPYVAVLASRDASSSPTALFRRPHLRSPLQSRTRGTTQLLIVLFSISALRVDESAKAPSVPSFLKPTPLLRTAQRSASHSDFLGPWPQSNQLMSKYAFSVQSRAFNLIAT
jgi:hypothetical protein